MATSRRTAGKSRTRTRDANIKKLGDRLSRPAFRKSFVRGHLAAMERAEIEAASIPKALLRTLASLSEEELEAIAKIKGLLNRAKVPPRIIVHMV